MWIARDKDGSLKVFMDEPVRENDHWHYRMDKSPNWRPLNDDSFPEITWESEPLEIKDELYFGIYLW